jgi:hypothetical protein
MPDPKTESPANDEVPSPPGDPLIGVSTRWRGGLLDANVWRLSPSSYRLDLDNRFDERNRFGTHLDLSTESGLAIDRYGLNGRFGFGQNTALNADWLHARDGQIYGADAAFKLGQNGNGTAAFRVDEPAGTSAFNTKLKLDDFHTLNADWLRTRDGQVYGADGAFKFGKDVSGTATFRVDEPAGTSTFNTKLKFDDSHMLNADWLRTRDGQVYGADGVFKLGKDGSGTAAFRVDEPAGRSTFNTKLKFDDFSTLNVDWLRTRDGQIYGADGAFKLGKDGSGTAAFRVDEPAGTSMFNTKLRFSEGYSLNADYIGSRLGAVYGADTAFKLGKGEGTGAFRVDEPAGTASMNAQLGFENGDRVSFDLDKGRNGAVIGADAAFGFGRGASGQFGLRIDQPAGTADYRLGAEFANGDKLRAGLGTGPQGASLNLGANLGFGNGAGALALDAGFGLKTSFGAGVDYRNPRMALGGQVRFDNGSGPLRMSEFAATFRTVDNPRHQFSLEAGYRPEARDAFVKVGWTFTFGGGSRPSKPIESMPEPALREQPSPIAAVPARTALPAADQALHEAALAGVRRLNASGAGLPVEETAASLALLAKQQGLRGIGYVQLGAAMADGRQNVFIGEGDPGDPAGRRAFMPRDVAAAAPVQDSLSKLAAPGGTESLDAAVSSRRPTMP